MNSNNPEIANTIKVIESIAPDGYGRMPIPDDIDSELQENIELAVQSESKTDYILNQNGVDSLFGFVERMATQCLRESDFQYCNYASRAMELILSQPSYDEKMVSVALALIHDSYFRLPDPRTAFEMKLLSRFHSAWNQFCSQVEQDNSCSSTLFRLGTEPDGPRYICYW